jgi:hypothetical protein
MVDYLGANRLEDRPVPRVFFQSRTERTSSRPRGPRRSLGEVLASAVGTGTELRISAGELRRIRALIEENRERILEAWYGHISAKR